MQDDGTWLTGAEILARERAREEGFKNMTQEEREHWLIWSDQSPLWKKRL